jgi:hypothetical protein
MATDFDARVNVKVPCPDRVRAGTKQWARRVELIPAAGGDWGGEWLTRGAAVALPVGTLLASAAEGRGRHHVDLWVVLPDGRLGVVAASFSPAWARELAGVARDYLARDARGRVARWCREAIARACIGGNDEVAPPTQERGWLAEASSPAMACGSGGR